MKILAGTVLLLGVVVAMLRFPMAPAVGLGLALAAGVVLDRTAMRAVVKVGVVVAILAAAVIAGVMVGWTGGSTRGITTGATVLARMFVLVIAAAVSARRIDSDRLLAVADRLGFERLGLILGLSLNALPRVADAVGEAWTALRVRRRTGSLRWRHLSGFLEVILAHTARIAEEAAAAAALRGHHSLGRPSLDMKVPTKVVVVTGPTNCGKTSVVETVVAELIGRGCGVSGFIQPGLWRSEEKVGFRVRDVRTGNEIDLARRVQAREGQHGTGFVFDNDGFDLASRALTRRRPDDVLVVDELGPLELRGRGHMPAVRQAIGDGSLRAVMLVVRRHLVPSLLLSLEAEDATVVDVTGSEGDPSSDVLSAVGTDCASSRPGKRAGITSPTS